MFEIVPADLSKSDIQDLILHHQRSALAANTVCEGHALSVEDYADPHIELFATYEAGELLAIGGLLRLDTRRGELKTMHTRDAARGKGIGQALLAHIIETAKGHGLKQLYLETGTVPFFAAATRLYGRMGFAECGPFEAYEANPDSLFMMRQI